MMRQEAGYRAAMRFALTRTPVRISAQGTRYPTRDELHDRNSLR
jgi:hypothetical protein